MFQEQYSRTMPRQYSTTWVRFAFVDTRIVKYNDLYLPAEGQQNILFYTPEMVWGGN